MIIVRHLLKSVIFLIYTIFKMLKKTDLLCILHFGRQLTWYFASRFLAESVDVDTTPVFSLNKETVDSGAGTND